MQIIMEANNSEYYRLRAIECIHANEYVKAIRLLVLAFLMREHTTLGIKNRFEED